MKQENKNELEKSWLGSSFFPSLFEEKSKDHFFGGSEVSVSEDTKNIYIEAALPGISPEEVEITCEKGILLIKADKKEETEDKDRKFYRKAHRHFFYQVPVPGAFDETKTPEAVCKDGMLKVCFQKIPSDVSKKKIQVKRG